jgi:hypothetical protein
MLVGLVFFLSERVPYAECKEQLKLAIALTESDFIRAMTLHNLAVVNYCELTDHNDRIINGDNIAEEQ